MTDAVYPVPDEWARKALIDADLYGAMYRESVEDPETFWRREAQRIDWMRPFSRVKETSFHEADFGIRWFADGALNLSANCLDRHLAQRGDTTAIIWEPDDPGEEGRTISYAELHRMVCRFANALKANGARRGDRDHHLYANGPRGGGGDARLRAHWRDPFGGVRRIFARGARRHESRIATARSSSPRTRGCAAASQFR